MRIHSPALTIVSICAVLVAGCRSVPGVTEGSGQVTLEYVAHACFRIASPSGSTVMIDPYESRWWLGYDFPAGLDPTDAVLSSHPHSDHDGGLAAEHELPYRHPDLEPDPDSADDLGEIDGWLAEQDGVRRLGTHVWQISRDDLPDRPEIVVFDHSPRVEPPS